MKKILAGVVVAACALGGGWFWLRDAAVVRVNDVFITGLSTSEAPSIRDALKAAALDMTTLHVREDQLRAAVAEFPSVAGVRADAKFPHKLTIEVRERAPVAAIETSAGRVAAAGDGRVLRGLKVSDLPTLRARRVPAGEQVTDRSTLGALAVAGGAPADLRGRIERLWSGKRGLTLDMRNGPDLVFGTGSDAARKWLAAVRVLADPSSQGATYLDLRVPERVAAGGLGPVDQEPEQTVPTDPQATVENSPSLNP